MQSYSTDKEQIEQLKTLWKDYGKPLVVGVIVAGLLVFGWRYWLGQKNERLAHASALYELLLVNQGAEDSHVAVLAKELTDNFENTPYSAAAGLLLAKDLVDEQDFEQAITQLRWVIDNAKLPELRDIARVRMAKIYLTQNALDTVFTALATIETATFLPLAEEIKGDAYMSQGELEQARNAYHGAWQILSQEGLALTALQMKLDNLGGPIN